MQISEKRHIVGGLILFGFGVVLGMVNPSVLMAQPSSPPAISSIADQGVYPNATSRPISFVVGDAETPASALVVSGNSSDTNLVPNSGLVFRGSDSNRNLTVTPAPGAMGTVTITVMVVDTDGAATSNTFGLDVSYFTPVTSGLPALVFSQAAWGDFDNDGDLDLLITGDDTTGAVARVCRNDNGTFTDANANLIGAERSQPGWADYDHDGYLDILITGGSTHLYHNNGDATFTEVAAGFPPISYGTFAWGDMDNDGDLDLLLVGTTNYPNSICQVWRNDGGGSFNNLLLPLPGVYFSSADWGDYDNDGDLDFLYSGYGAGGVLVTKLMRNDGNGAFTEVAAGLPAVYGSTTAWGDYDNDGDLDIFLNGRDSNGSSISRIYRNDAGAFTDIGAGLTGGWAYRTAWADFDNDGFLDVAAGGRDAQTRLYRNNRNQTFSQVTVTLTNLDEGVATWADYDNDGDLDLLLIGNACFYGCPMVQLYRNNGPTNGLPSPPAGLGYTLQPGNDVLLRWNASADSQTSSNGLTYNLRVGTSSGGIQISPPQSDLATGFRRVPQPGPAHTNRWRLVDLAKGTYYWSAQALDTTFAGSLFSTQAVFTITNSRPIISTAPLQVTFPNLAVSNLSVTVGDAETAATALVLAKSSGNTNLLPDANILLGGTGSNRTMTLIPVGNRGGETVVTLTLTDTAGLTRSTNIVLRVDAFTSLASIGPSIPTNATAISASCLSWADYDNDGDLDILFTREYVDTYYYDETIILRNDSGGVFTPVNIGLTNIYAMRVAWGDVDDDGRPDLLLMGFERDGSFSPRWTRLCRNTGSGTFEPLPVQLPRLDSGTVSIADINGDGYADLFVAGNLGGPYLIDVTKVFLGNGHGAFTEWETDLPVAGIYNTSSQWGDVDNDGDNDLLLGSGGLFRNDGNGHFTDISTRIPPPPWGSVSVDWADLDIDGDLDILVAGTTNAICRNNGDGSFAILSAGITNIWYGTSVALADYNNDGWVDVVLSPNGGSLFRNNGNLTFSLAETNLPPGLWGDFDGDGDLDIAARDKVSRNNSAILNTPPAAPKGLVVTPQPGTTVLLSWSRPADAQTVNSNGLCYNLRVGTTLGGIDVLSPLAHATNGLRRVVQRGNAGSTNRWLLRDLPRGTYYWSAQAIDGAFAGSPFASNATFAVTRPDISAIPDQIVAPGFALPPLPFLVSDDETAASNLVLSASSSNTNLVALTNIIFGGTGTNRTVTITPTPGLVGTNIITITVTDDSGFTDSSTFKFIVLPFLPLGGLSVGTSSRVYPADYNNDSLMDLLVIGNSVQLWRNLGGGNFTNDATGLPASITGRAVWGDYDNDGYLDIAFGDSTNVFHNDLTNHFTAVASGMSQIIYTMAAVSWGDYDGDGRLDLMRMHWGYVQLYHNLGNGTFADSGIPLQWGQVGSLGWADLNNDGKLDLVVSGDFTGGGSFFTYIYRGNGGTNLTLVVSNTIVGVRWSSVAFRDFDGDGDLDILLAGDRTSGGSQTCRVYRNDGNFNFTNYVELAADTVRNAAWGDYNNDGLPDVLAYGSQATTAFVNNGDGTFSNIQANLPTVDFNGAAWADFDNDGDLDIIADRLFANLRPPTNQPPQAPTGLAATFVSNVMVLSWNAPTDDSTSSNALTYSVRLGTNSGGSQILAADADPATGFRRLVPEGNTWPNRFRLMPNLHDGNYYWTVQAIDSGYAGSPFALEASFTYFHPTISGPLNVVVYPTAPPALISFTVGDADSSADSLVLTASSSNTNLLAVANIVFGGSGSNRTATLNFTPGAVGTSIVSVVVTDLAGLTATNSFRFESAYFTDITPVFSGSNLFNGKWGDYDNDNDLDLYLGSSVYRNDGNLVFTRVADLLAGERNAAAWGDYDRDGDLDLAIAGGSIARIYRNDGSGVFTDIGAALMQGLSNVALAWGDYDNDGRLDLVLSGYLNGGRYTMLYHNNGNGTFSSVSGTGLAGVDEAAFAWGDYDNDGRLDLLVSGGVGPSTFFTEVYHNNGKGTFTPIGAGMIGIREGSVAWGDFDNDGNLDALATGFYYGNYILNVYRNSGNGTFTDINVGLQGTAFGEGQWADFDNDGYLDILVSGCIVNYCDTRTTSIYRNNRDGTFSDINAGLPPMAGSACLLGGFRRRW